VPLDPACLISYPQPAVSLGWDCQTCSSRSQFVRTQISPVASCDLLQRDPSIAFPCPISIPKPSGSGTTSLGPVIRGRQHFAEGCYPCTIVDQAKVDQASSTINLRSPVEWVIDILCFVSALL